MSAHERPTQTVARFDALEEAFDALTTHGWLAHLLAAKRPADRRRRLRLDGSALSP